MEHEQLHWDVIVIGAGAAGMLAASRAAKRGRRTLLIEKNRKLGVKILISGGTRCNITHDADETAIAAAFPKLQGRFLRSALAHFPPEQLLSLVHAAGVPTKVESTGKVFPVSDRAIDVRDALVSQVRGSGCQILREWPVERIKRLETGFQLSSDNQTITADKIIIACGGQSYSGCGTTGDGYGWARALGHTIVQPVPALAPLRSPDEWVRGLQGITLPDVRLSVVSREEVQCELAPRKTAILDSRRDSLLFTHFGLSGPAAMNVSRAISRVRSREVMLLIDFWPDRPLADCLHDLRCRAKSVGGRPATALLDAELPRRLADSLLQLASIAPRQRAAEISNRHLQQLANCLKGHPITVSGTSGFAKAEVTSGGVSLAEIDSRTMESKRVPGCYFAGEVLDIDGPIGGYNFQAAFSTGWLAGSSV